MSGKNRKKKDSRKKRRERREKLLKQAGKEAVPVKEKPGLETEGIQEAAAAKEEEERQGAGTAGEKEEKREADAAGEKEEKREAGTAGEKEEKREADAAGEENGRTEDTETAGGPEKKGTSGWKQFSRRKKAGIMGAAVLGIAAAGYGGMAWRYQDKLLPGTTVNQVACGEMTLEDIEEQIRAQAEDYSLTLLLRDGQKAEITPELIAYHYVPDGSVEKILEEQNMWLWLPAMLSPREYQVAENVEFDRQLLSDFVDSLPQTQADQVTAPADASVVYQEGGFVIQPEVEGNQLKTEELKQALEQAVRSGQRELSAEEAGLYQEPSVRQDDALLLAQRDQLNELANASVTYQMPGGETLVLDGNTLKGWLCQDEAGNYYRDDEIYNQHLDSFVREMEGKIDDVGSERTFRSTNYGEYTLSGGSYGWILSRAKEKEQLKNELAAGAVLTREPVYKQKGVNSQENDGIGNTYVEIDMSNQHMWFYKDGECVLDSDVVTGTMVRSRYTPEGIYYLYFKQRNRVLRGEILPSTGKPEYETPVSYWMPFNGGIGLHDADWNSYFGGQKYIYSGSHGCINLPGRVAGKLYSMIEVGTPVICYYPEGYSLHG